MMRHNFEPNTRIWDTGKGGLRLVAECECGVCRQIGRDYTSVRPDNNWGPKYFDAKGNRIPNAGPCRRETGQFDEDMVS